MDVCFIGGGSNYCLFFLSMCVADMCSSSFNWILISKERCVVKHALGECCNVQQPFHCAVYVLACQVRSHGWCVRCVRWN